MKLTDFLTDPVNNRGSESKLFAIVGKVALTWAFVHVHRVATVPPSEWLWLAYGGLILGHEGYSRLNSYKNPKQPKPEDGQ